MSLKKGTVLFDLDGTLLPVDIDFFLKRYLEEVAIYFRNKVDPQRMVEAIMIATQKMVEDLDPSTSNLDVFAAAFEPLVQRSWQLMWPEFMAFYKERFPELGRLVPRNEEAVSVVGQCLEAGWDLVLATNPMFPECAILERMKWCGIHEFPWRLITSLENMHFCKPKLEYYKEIVQMADLDPKACVMVGNDPHEDMIAGKLGMRTFLVQDFVVDRQEGEVPHGRGSLLDVPAFVGSL